MSGKAYTMKEMKGIVEYLIEQKAFSGIKGRKMWMDFANTKLTSRTWQSLKETFLKRILPDIHNPYYNLNMDQIRSFKQGQDVVAKEKARLMIKTESDTDSNAEANNDEPSTSNNNKEADEPPGETIKSSQITSRNRSSADTVILEKCYETADEIRKDLESPKVDGNIESRTMSELVEDRNSAAKSVSDFLKNSEMLPMTPTMQKLLDDFASEPESENELKAQGKVPDTNKPVPEEETQIDVPDTETIIVSSDVASEDIYTKANNQPQGSKDSKVVQITSTPLEEVSDLIVIEDSCEIIALDTNTIGSNTQSHGEIQNLNSDGIDVLLNTMDVATSNMNKPCKDICEKNETIAQNCSNTTTDASLPNNPEGFNNTEKMNGLNKPETISDNTKTKKRSNSSNIENIEIKKKRIPTKSNEDEQSKSCDESKSKAIGTDKEVASKDIVEEQKEIEQQPISHKSTTCNQNISTDVSAELDHNVQLQNPCLKSVSLYEEQFNKTKYTDSELSGEEISTKKIPEPNVNPETNNLKDSQKSNFPDEVVLKSCSEAESDQNEKAVKKKQTPLVSTKIKRDKALATMFGFAGGSSSGHKNVKRSRHKKSKRRHYSDDNQSSESSEWTSQSASEEYVSPPRGKKNRHTRKYLKPHSARVLSLEEEGGLFVMHGKKIFPVVKDGKIVKNYVTYLPDSESEENYTYWKQKYLDEKNKAEELKRLLEEQTKQSKTRDPSPVLRPSSFRNSTSTANSRHSARIASKEQDKMEISDDENKAGKRENQEKVKIKFTRNNEEVHLEGHWQQIHPVLEQVVQIFNKDSDHGDKVKPIAKVTEQKRIASGESTPIVFTLPSDPEVKEKIDRLEKDIFKQIEELDEEEPSNEESQPQPNVTKRKAGRPRKPSSASPHHSPAKKPRLSKNVNNSESKKSVANNQDSDNLKNKDGLDGKTSSAEQEKQKPEKMAEKKLDSPVLSKVLNKSSRKSMEVVDAPNTKSEPTEDKVVSSSTTTSTVNLRKTRTPKKIGNETETSSNTSSMQTRRSNVRKPEDTPSKKATRSSTKIENITQKKTTNTRRKPTRKSLEAVPMTSLPDLSMNSIDSTQGYQDSDISPPNMIKKKKKLNLSSLLLRSRRSGKRRTYSVPNISSDSSNSSFNVPIQENIIDHSSLNTEVYRSESYQLLIPQPRTFNKLAKIDEALPVPNLIMSTCNVSTAEIANKLNSVADSNNGLEVGSSSNVSLPLSPELSFVERLSVTQEMIDCVEEPTLNEIHTNFSTDPHNFDNYLISAVDISVPLMEQECGLEQTGKNTCNQQIVPNTSVVSQSLLTKVCSVNIKDNSSLFRSLDQKLQELLLESAKKIAQSKNIGEDNEMEVDVTNSEDIKKATTKKRCSTPRKRKGTQKSKQPKVATVVEEHTEACTHSGRKSCPPVLNVLSYEIKELNTDTTYLDNVTKAVTANKTKRQKKDVIKVKIVRPKEKKKSNISKNNTRISINTDSGINDVDLAISFDSSEDSVELIHNHSETCLQANECIGNSVEFIETSSRSIISLNSNSQSLEQNDLNLFEFANGDITPELFCNNAQDITEFEGIKTSEHQTGNSDSQCNTEYHSPFNTECLNDSLLTEDLSDEPPSQEVRPTKWYLLSEDETTNTNIGAGSNKPNSQYNSFGSSLKQLFPIACAVPNLSTITEMSRENDDSRKPTLDEEGDTRNDMDSQSLF